MIRTKFKIQMSSGILCRVLLISLLIHRHLFQTSPPTTTEQGQMA